MTFWRRRRARFGIVEDFSEGFYARRFCQRLKPPSSLFALRGAEAPLFHLLFFEAVGARSDFDDIRSVFLMGCDGLAAFGDVRSSNCGQKNFR
jgi:hypothetical protein